MTERGVLALIAFVVCPLAYVIVLGLMAERQVPHPPRIPFFIIFGTIGGWALAFLLSPGGLGALSILFMMIAPPLALLAGSIGLLAHPERTVFHKIAIWSGLLYIPALALALWFFLPE